MGIFATGLNFKTATIEDLERCVISKEDMASAHLQLKEKANLQELVFVSTCNRVEAYCITDDVEKAASEITSFFISKSGIPAKHLQSLLFKFEENKAIEHLYKVASGVESMVIGDAQILGQLREAYKIAFDNECTGKILNRLFQTATTLGKKIKTDTVIGKKPVSIASVAVRLATLHFENIEDLSVFLIGAGEMAEDTANSLNERQIKEMYIFNRSPNKAVDLAKKFNGKTVPTINEGLTKSDIVISSTASPDFIIDKNQIQEIMQIRNDRPLMLIDITIPRDIDPEVGTLQNIRLYNIDDLRTITMENKKEIEKDIEIALNIIKEEIAAFLAWLKFMNISPLIKDLSSRIEMLCVSEISKNLNRLINAESKEDAAQALAKSLTKKILHDPITVLRENGKSGSDTELETVRNLFKLDI